MRQQLTEDLAELVAEVYIHRNGDPVLVGCDMRWTIEKVREALSLQSVQDHIARIGVQMMRANRMSPRIILAELQRRLDSARSAEEAVMISQTMFTIMSEGSASPALTAASAGPMIQYIRDTGPVQED